MLTTVPTQSFAPHITVCTTCGEPVNSWYGSTPGEMANRPCGHHAEVSFIQNPALSAGGERDA